jgi:hypothetical protein
LGQGLCRKDTGHRGVFFNDKHKLDAMEIDATPNGYQTCKDRANKLGATVFSLQFKHGANKAECWIGDNPGVSVGMNRNDDGFRHDETNICGLYGGPWSQNVYIKQPPKKYIEPDTTIYYFKDDDVKKFIKNLLDQGYTDIMDALCRNKEDSTLHL